MRILGGSRELAGQGPFALAIGIFDAVHLGHQALLREAVRLANRDDIESLAYSFNPHPAKVLAPSLAPRLLETVETRIERLASMGIDTALIEPFDRTFASQEPEAFVRDILVGVLGARHVVVGMGFTFGRSQRGTVALLRALGAELGFVTHAIEPVKVDGILVSSTKVREFVASGRMQGAAMLLGRPYELEGAVVRGDGRGGTLGFPTANIDPINELLPGVGVYAARVSGTFPARDAVVNVGYAPTFGGGRLKVEAHILDGDPGPLYGATLVVQFIEKLRDETRFDSGDALKAQIGADIAAARALFR